MNSLVLLIVCVAILGIGYVCYGGWLCKQWGVGESKTAWLDEFSCGVGGGG